jgi:hypothetical protein
MFGIFKRRRETKLMQDAMEIIGKALILEEFHSEDATAISAVSMDVLLKNIDEVRGIHGYSRSEVCSFSGLNF